ncbi:MAG: bifunctional glutamate N-acetyltransferase/amino-acid acetyltransferase ArgJ [Rubrimonas sp.]|uniref:bifunctional glutamate N-acetyltransferase/amino-acid acetyltransferase ArgJ n=1 Tax=Rubrimonas sp. TaxID=2036015 RepID=UPI002FDEA7CA
MAALKPSPFAPACFPDLPAVRGVKLAGGPARVRYAGRDDVMLAEIAAGASVAGVFTRSRTRAAPVLWCEARLAARRGGAVASGPLCFAANSGNANAFTGANGADDARRMAEAAGAAVGAPAASTFVASTGVIGEPLPVARIEAALGAIAETRAEGAWERAARAIMTTDTFPKAAGRTVALDGVEVRIAGFAKGSGMIAPDMATMLAFAFTDAAIAEPLLQRLLAESVDRSFNAITVDGDTSTSDTLLLAATGASGAAEIASDDDPRLPAFREALDAVLLDLAQLVVKDGEGASKFVAITVTGAETAQAARRIGLSIANSPLVKTALAGEDPNWGRIVMAVGKSGEAADRDRLEIRFGDILVAEKGWVAPAYREEDGAAYMKRAELEILVDVGVGAARATVWTCDLTHAYIDINADYRS